MKSRFFALALCMLLATAALSNNTTASSSQDVAPCFIFDDLMEC